MGHLKRWGGVRVVSFDMSSANIFSLLDKTSRFFDDRRCSDVAVLFSKDIT